MASAFNPADHPRGNPANAGQFASKHHAEADVDLSTGQPRAESMGARAQRYRDELFRDGLDELAVR